MVLRGAQACNVCWQVGSSATLGVSSTFVGTILALTSIEAHTDAFIHGRLLTRTASTTLDSNIITRPICAADVTTTTDGSGGTTSTTTSGGTGDTTSTTTAGGGGDDTTATTTAAGGGATVTTAPAGGGGGGTPTTAPGGSAFVTPPNERVRGGPPLAFGGAHIRWELSAAVIAFMLGGLLIVLAGPEPSRRRPAARS